ncbi:MAG: hypothetical protein IPK08_17915 [Bacteroidetes bacterium]|nr:hypothetical protein [Bacteroidota bacterium]
MWIRVFIIGAPLTFEKYKWKTPVPFMKARAYLARTYSPRLKARIMPKGKALTCIVGDVSAGQFANTGDDKNLYSVFTDKPSIENPPVALGITVQRTPEISHLNVRYNLQHVILFLDRYKLPLLPMLLFRQCLLI